MPSTLGILCIADDYILYFPIAGIGKSLIGINSGSLEDSAVIFACITWFSAMADRTMLQPSLSRDRK